MLGDEMEATVLKQGEWMCSQCGQSVETQYLVCWSCGGPRDGVRIVENPMPVAKHSGCGCGTGGCGSGRPAGGLHSLEVPAEFDERIQQNNRFAGRTLATAVIGAAIPPVAVVAVLMVMRASMLPMSGLGSRRFYQAFALSVASVSIWGWWLKSYFN